MSVPGQAARAKHRSADCAMSNSFVSNKGILLFESSDDDYIDLHAMKLPRVA
jgi:hypothetical protein